MEEAMLRRALLIGTAASLLLLPGTALAGRQQLPDAACNAGTATAHSMIPYGSKAHDRVPHSHDSVTCVHFNPAK